MTEQEKRQAELAAKYEGGHLTDSFDDKRKRSEKAAVEWVKHFRFLTEFVKTLDDDEDLSSENLIKLLVDEWESKRHDSDIEMAKSIRALKSVAA